MSATASAAEIAVAQRSRAWSKAVPGAVGWCRRAAEAALAVALPRAGPVEISIVLADDAFVRALNRDWRGRDSATNVLAFPTGEAAGRAASGPPILLGDVVVALETVCAEAARDGRTPEAHLAHLVVHGVLHLLGHDHEAEAEAAAMEAAEARALAEIGIENPYAGSHPSDA